MVVLTAFLAVGFGVPMTFASEPAPAEQKDQKGQKEKKDTTSSKADDEKEKDEKKDMGGK
jgi:ribosomal protein L12E/L44/L45/RPP1/RPP2